MNLNDDIKERMSIWPRKLTSLMEIQRQRYSQLNKKFKQRPVINLSQSSKIQPIILPQASRPQPRQQPRLRQQIHLPSTRRSTTAQIQHQKPPPSPLISEDQKYITLANLSKLLHVLQINDKIKDRSDTPTDNTSTSTSTSAKQRVQQHLQETATRWWRPIRSSDSHPLSSTVQTSGLSTVMQQYTDENVQLERNIPLLTIVSNSTHQMNIPIKTACNESEVSTEVLTTNDLTSFVSPIKILSSQRTRQEPLIMQARGMHLHSYDHRYYNNNHNNMNFFQQQRLIRQT